MRRDKCFQSEIDVSFCKAAGSWSHKVHISQQS